MKEKTSSQRRFGSNFLKVHALLFALFEAALAANILLTISRPSNTLVSLDNFRTMIIQSMAVSLIWAMIFVGHVTVNQLLTIRRQRHQREYLETVKGIQERYAAGERLDLDAYDDEDNLTDEQKWQYAEEDTIKYKSS